jgi:hypothetical protein
MLAEQVGIGLALADLGAHAPGPPEKLERRVVVTEQLSVSPRLLIMPLSSERCRSHERRRAPAGSSARPTVAAALRRQDAELPSADALDLAVADVARRGERFLDRALRPS